MNPGFRDLGEGAFESGLARLDKDPEWRDDRVDLDGPFRLRFPQAQGWGEELLVASLLKRYAGASKNPVEVFASAQVCSILEHDSAFLPKLRRAMEGRSPLAILRHALMGNLLDEPFLPLAPFPAGRPSTVNRRLRLGIAWASVSKGRCISKKSVPVGEFLSLLTGIDADFISLQRKLAVADPNGLAKGRGIPGLADEVLDATTDVHVNALVEAIRSLDCLVTISTTTTHIAAAMGVRVELIAAEREGQQWFWRVQGRDRNCFYPSVRIHIGNATKGNWWKQSLASLKA